MARNTKGMGSVYFVEKSGLWRASITLPDGRRKVKASKQQKQVKEWLIKERSKIQDGVFVSDTQITLASFLTRYIDEYCTRTLRATTLQSYKMVIRDHIIPDLGNLKLASLRADQINHLLAKKMESGLSNRFVEYIHGILKRSLNVAVKWGLLVKNPALLVTPPKVKFKIPNTWDSEQVKKFLDSLENDRWAGIYYLAMTGMRKGEILGLPLSALDLEKGTLMVIQTLQYLPGQGLLILEPKTENSKRKIILPIFIVDALKKHLAKREALTQLSSWKERGLVFTTDIGTPIFPRNMIRHFKDKLHALGLPEIRFHDIRHSVASILLEKNTHPRLVAELLGHSSIKVTLDRYSHIINPMNRVVADTLDDLVG